MATDESEYPAPEPGDSYSWEYARPKAEEYPPEKIALPRVKRWGTVTWYEVREFFRTLVWIGLGAITFSVTYILLSLIVHGGIKW